MVESTSKLLDEFKFSQAAEDLYAFTWNDLADWYLEISKIQNSFHFQWQRDYFERIIRNKNELNHIRKYIINNPLKWKINPL